MKVDSVLVVGSGSAGLIAALSLKKKLPHLKVTVVSSSRLGIIGVGEGTVPYVVNFIHQYLGMDEHRFFQEVDPVYKLGVRFTWGSRDYFDYTFSQNQWAFQAPDLGRPSGFFAQHGHHGIDLPGALMEHTKALPTRGAGFPDLPPAGNLVAWHLENQTFVAWLDRSCEEAGVTMIDGEIESVEQADDGSVKRILLQDGRRLSGDLFVDASGFRSELLGKTLEEPYESFHQSLFCDRAVVGGWDRRPGESILPYTRSDTMNGGWCWRIDHPGRINRGYVYSSNHLTDEEAETELRQFCPEIETTRIVKFRSGRHQRVWVKNVVAIGNAAGFVEPLEATAIMSICLQTRWLTDGLIDSQQAPNPSLINLYNLYSGQLWDEVKEFLAIHYRLNQRLETPFWKDCRSETKLSRGEDLLEFYRENGPSRIAEILIPKDSPFGIEGYFAMLVGMNAPMEKKNDPAFQNGQLWKRRLQNLAQIGARGMSMETVREKLQDPEVWKAIRAGG